MPSHGLKKTLSQDNMGKFCWLRRSLTRESISRAVAICSSPLVLGRTFPRRPNVLGGPYGRIRPGKSVFSRSMIPITLHFPAGRLNAEKHGRTAESRYSKFL